MLKLLLTACELLSARRGVLDTKPQAQGYLSPADLLKMLIEFGLSAYSKFPEARAAQRARHIQNAQSRSS